jgi:hypothetical protein
VASWRRSIRAVVTSESWLLLSAAKLTAEFAWVGEARELWLKPTAPAAAARAAVNPTT